MSKLTTSICLSWALLSTIILSLLPEVHSRRFGTSYYLEDMDEAYYDMGQSMDQGITKVDWQMERKLATKPSKKTKASAGSTGSALNLNEKCTLKFISSANKRRRGSEVVLFSTGEVGYWKIKNPSAPPVLTASYNKALASLSRSIEIEVPSASDSGNDKGVLVYTLTLGAGTVQPLAVLARGKGSVKYYPRGRSFSSDESDDGDGGVDIGSCEMHVKSGRPVMDPQWSRGRRWWWTSKERPGMRTSGL